MAALEKSGGGGPESKDPVTFKALEFACEGFAGLALVAIVLLISTDVFARNALGFSTQVSEEYSGYLLVMAAFFSFPVAVSRGLLHRFELLDGYMGPRGRVLVGLLVLIACLAVALVTEWQLGRYVLLSMRSGAAAPTLAGTPLWIPQLAMPLGFGVLCLVLALRTLCTMIAISRWGRNGA